MRILTRYLLRAHLGPFLFALLALTGILFVNNIARRFQDFAGKGLPMQVILEIFALSLPHILALTLPMAVLVAVLYAFAQLAAENEITALKASGTNLVRVIMPILFVAFLFAGFMLWFNDRLLPDANHALKNLITDVTAKTPTLELTEQVVTPIRTQDFRTRYWLKADRIDGQRMWDVVIYDLSEPGRARSIYADSGRMAMNPGQTDLMLSLYAGFMHEVTEGSPTELHRVHFNEQRVELKGVGTELQRSQDTYRSDREMSVAMLQQRVDSALAELAALRAEATALNKANLENILNGPAGPEEIVPEITRGRRPMPLFDRAQELEFGDGLTYRAGLDAQRLANNERTLQDIANQYQVEIHKKFAIPFACIIFVLLGAPLAVRFPRGGVGMVIAASLTIFSIYYMSLIGGESLGDRGIIRPFWGPWAPNLLFGALAVWALSRIGRETATSRGGDWDDLLLSIRNLLTGGFLRRRDRTGEAEG
jgi:lipopolysaccharide export system permease protein